MFLYQIKKEENSMKKQIVGIVMFFSYSVCASECEYPPEFIEWCDQTKEAFPQPYYPIISLGINCQVAYQLRIHGLRHEAFPFDWIICPFEALVALIENHFEHFLDPEYLRFVHTETEKCIVNTLYNVKFLHDFKLVPHFMQDYEKVKAMYDRRIKRFYHNLQNTPRALLIRRKITQAQAIQLQQVLQKQFPDTHFLLLAVDNTYEIKKEWDIPQVKNYYMPQQPTQTWKGDTALWTELFTLLNLHITLEEPQDELFKRD